MGFREYVIPIERPRYAYDVCLQGRLIFEGIFMKIKGVRGRPISLDKIANIGVLEGVDPKMAQKPSFSS